jgi:hypothetical protein
MAVIEYGGLTLVAEAPHRIGRGHSHHAGRQGRDERARA